MSISTIKKGGASRRVITGATNATSFTVPAGFYLDQVLVESTAKVAGGTISLGTTNDAIEVATLTVTGAPTANGNITVGGVAIAILDADVEAGVATKIRAGVYTGWVTGGTGAVVTFTATGAGNKTNITFVDTDTTGATASVTTSAGTQPVDVVADVALPADGTANTIFLTLVKKVFSGTADTTIYINCTNDSVFTIYPLVQKYN